MRARILEGVRGDTVAHNEWMVKIDILPLNFLSNFSLIIFFRTKERQALCKLRW